MFCSTSNQNAFIKRENEFLAKAFPEMQEICFPALSLTTNFLFNFG